MSGRAAITHLSGSLVGNNSSSLEGYSLASWSLGVTHLGINLLQSPARHKYVDLSTLITEPAGRLAMAASAAAVRTIMVSVLISLGRRETVLS